jgi:hypothetical protein
VDRPGNGADRAERSKPMSLVYVRKFKVERLKIAIQGCQKKQGAPLPLTEIGRLASEFSVQSEYVRRIERKDVDLAAYTDYVRKMKLAGVDADKSAGDRVRVGGKESARNKKEQIRKRLQELLEEGADIDFGALNEEFELAPKSRWPQIILSEIQRKAAGKEKRPVSPEQRELVMEMLRALGANFGLPGEQSVHKENVDRLLDKCSMSQIHKAIKNLYHLQRTTRSLRSDFCQRVVRPLLDAVDFTLFRR